MLFIRRQVSFNCNFFYTNYFFFDKKNICFFRFQTEKYFNFSFHKQTVSSVEQLLKRNKKYNFFLNIKSNIYIKNIYFLYTFFYLLSDSRNTFISTESILLQYYYFFFNVYFVFYLFLLNYAI